MERLFIAVVVRKCDLLDPVIGTLQKNGHTRLMLGSNVDDEDGCVGVKVRVKECVWGNALNASKVE